MPAATKLEPITRDRADELARLLRAASSDDSKAIALDDEGCATDLIDAEDPGEEHAIGDLAVHA